MVLKSLAFLAAALPFISASPALSKRWNPAGYDTSPQLTIGPDNAECSRQTYTISVTSENTIFTNLTPQVNETILANFFQEFVSSLPSYSNFTDEFLAGGKKNITGEYSISGTLCKPKDYKGRSPTSIQLLVHGIGFDSSYWNFRGSGVPEDYSYVRAAAEAGATTFRYDRLGTGLSEHPKDTLNVVQAPTDLAILTEIASRLRSGKIGGTAYTEIIGVGHSYGSVQVEALSATIPAALNGVVLTGFSTNTSAVQLYLSSGAYSTATNVFPDRFSPDELPSTYLATATVQQNALNFLRYNGYTIPAANLARATEQPVSVGVLSTFANLVQPAPQFNGKVFVVTGDKDWIFCLTNCYAVPPGSSRASILDYVEDLYPANTGFSTYLPANTGHGIAAHETAPENNRVIQAFIGNNFS